MTLGEDLGFTPDRRAYRPDSRLVLPDCRVGLEFEFEKVRNAELPSEPWAFYWQAKRDGSLHDQGMEYVFTEPLFGQDAIRAIEGLMGWAQAHKWAVNIRTGLHVHHDARDMSQEELVRECVLYALFEKCVYDFVGNNREENVFCMPWFASFGATRAVKNIITATSGEVLRMHAERIADEKYAGLNLDTLARFGSVEWRHALATKESGDVLRWVNLVLRFKEAAQRIKMTGPELIRWAKRDVVGLSAEAFREQHRLLDNGQLAANVLEFGIPTALDLVVQRHKFNPNMDWVNALPKEKKPNKSFQSWATGLKEKKQQKTKKSKQHPLGGVEIIHEAAFDIERANQIIREHQDRLTRWSGPRPARRG